MNYRKTILLALCLSLVAFRATPLFAESQGQDYKGITDPFGDPSNYEFSEDEKSDKEFFHLGRFFILGLDLGVGVFTGGLGKTNEPGFYVGGKLLYFFDKSFALEAGVHYAHDTDTINVGANVLQLDTAMLPITTGLRYYFDTKNAPRAIALANPYLAAGAGVYIRTQNPTIQSGLTAQPNTSSNFGAYAGAGCEFNVYERHVLMGLDFRYHIIWFNDSDQTYGGVLPDGSRSGGYFTGALSLSYSF